MKTNDKPTDENKLREEYEEALIKLAMSSFAEREGQRLMQENEALKNDPFYQPSAEADRKFKRTMNRYYKQKTKNFMQTSYQHFNKVAIVFLISIILLATSTLAVEAVRIKVLNFFVNVQQEYTEIRLKEKSGEPSLEEKDIISKNVPSNWKNAYAPLAIPVGYSINNSVNNDNFKTIEYANDRNEMIIYQQFDEQVVSNIDTEKADSIEKITVQGHKGLLVNKDGKRTITWSNDAKVFLIITKASNLQDEDMIKMAESVTLIK
ncbi:MAG: DUF4367 domain-containing protein [Syntrophomonas sp.]